MELSLRDSELRYRRLFEAAQDGILILDAKTGMIEDVNPYLIRMLGYSREEFVEKKLWEVGAFQDIEASKDAFEVLQDREYIRYEDLPLRTKDGRMIEVEFVSNVYLVGDKKVIQCNIRDITEHKRIITALLANEKKYHDLLNQSSDGIFIIDLTGNILTVNKAMCRELEFSEEEFLSMKIWELIPEEYVNEYRERLTKILAGEIFEKPGEYEVRGKDGRNHYVEILSTPHYYGQDIVGFQGIAHDITARKQAEKALYESEERFRNAFQYSAIGMAMVSLNGNWLKVNSMLCSIVGYSEDELLSLTFQDLTHPEDLHRDLTHLKQLLAGEIQSYKMEKRYFHKDGQVVWVFLAVALARDDEGAPLYLIAQMKDITERKQAEKALYESEERFRQVWEATSDAMALSDPEGIVLASNPAYLELYGYPTEQVIGRSFAVIFPEENRKQAVQQYKAIFASEGNPPTFESAIRRMDGTERIVESKAAFLTVEGRRMAMLSTIRDITERKQTEEVLREKGRLLSESQRIGHVGSWSYDIATDTFQYSDEMYRLLDVSAQDFQHHKAGFLNLIYPSDRPMVTTWMEAIQAGTKAKELNFRLFRQNGELRYIQSQGAVIFDSSGNPARFTGTAQDMTKHKLDEIQIHQQIQRMTALRKIDASIISTVDLGTVMETVLAQVVVQLQVDAADILQLHPNLEMLDLVAGRGFRTLVAKSAQVPIVRSLAGRVAKERRLIQVEDLREPSHGYHLSDRLAEEGFVSYVGVPLITKGKVKGVLEVFHRTPLHPYAEWIDFFNALAGQAAIAIENASLFANLEQINRDLSQAYDSTIEGWSRALDLRDKETEGHTLRVTELTLALAQKFSFTDTQMQYIRWGGLLHDIGKMGIADHILLKPESLNEEEGVIMRKHPQFAYDLLQPIAFLTPALDIPYCHHEKWDGTGYPRGLKGEEIPLPARIFAVADVWDALSSDRPYRPAWPKEKVLEYIQSISGTHFDPQVVDVFMRSLH